MAWRGAKLWFLHQKMLSKLFRLVEANPSYLINHVSWSSTVITCLRKMKTLWHKFSAYGLFNIPVSEELEFWIAYVTRSHNPLSWICFEQNSNGRLGGKTLCFCLTSKISDWFKYLATSCSKTEQGCHSFLFPFLSEMSAWQWKKWANLSTVSFTRWNKTHCCPWSQSWSVCSTLQLENRTNCEKTICLLRFQGARPDHLRVESSKCCFPRELVSFDTWHVLLQFDSRV